MLTVIHDEYGRDIVMSILTHIHTHRVSVDTISGYSLQLIMPANIGMYLMITGVMRTIISLQGKN